MAEEPVSRISNEEQVRAVRSWKTSARNRSIAFRVRWLGTGSDVPWLTRRAIENGRNLGEGSVCSMSANLLPGTVPRSRDSGTRTGKTR